MPAYMFDAVAAETVMLVNNQQETSPQIRLIARVYGPPYQACRAVPPRVVRPLGHAGPPAALRAGTILPGTEEGGIDLVRIGGDQPAAVRRRHTAPQAAQTLPTTVTHVEGQHLARQSRDGAPEVAGAPPAAI